jgi:nucleotide-binding universal stress UspA family protein
MFKNILVPVDGSEMSNAAIKKICSLAGEDGAHLTFYHAMAIFIPNTIVGDTPVFDVSTLDSIREAAKKHAESILQAAVEVATEAGVKADTLSDESERPYQGIIAAAESKGCDLIFMASHGRSPASALILGSETQKVLAHCKIPVLVYR